MAGLFWSDPDDDLKPVVLNGVTPVRGGRDGEPEDKLLATGSYGFVCQVEVNGLVHVAKKPKEKLKKVVTDFKKECCKLSKLKHSSIVQFIGVYYGSNKEDIALVVERLQYDLADFLDANRGSVEEYTKFSILKDVSFGLVYLHAANPLIIHRALTAQNILLTTSLQPKIADIGLAKLVGTSGLPQWQLNYIPREALKEINKVGLDIFSFGHLCLHTLIEDYPELDASANKEKLRRQKSLDLIGEEHKLHAIIVSCLHDNPDRRPPSLQVFEYIYNLVEDEISAQCIPPNKVGDMLQKLERSESKVKDLESWKKKMLQERKDYIQSCVKEHTVLRQSSSESQESLQQQVQLLTDLLNDEREKTKELKGKQKETNIETTRSRDVQRIRELEVELEKTKEDFENTRHSLEAEKAERNILLTKLAAQAASQDQHEIRKLQDDLNEQSKALHRADSENTNLKNIVSILKDKVKQANTDLTEAKQRLLDTEEECQKLKQDVSVLTENLESSEKRCKNLIAFMHKSKQSTVSSEAGWKQKYESLEKKDRDNQLDISQLQHKLKCAQDELDELLDTEEECQKLKQDVSVLTENLESSEKRCKNLIAFMDKSKQSTVSSEAGWKQKYESLEKKDRDNQLEISQLQHKLKCAQDELDEMKKQSQKPPFHSEDQSPRNILFLESESKVIHKPPLRAGAPSITHSNHSSKPKVCLEDQPSCFNLPDLKPGNHRQFCHNKFYEPENPKYTKALEFLNVQVGDLSEEEMTSLKELVEQSKFSPEEELEHEIQSMCDKMIEQRAEMQELKRTDLHQPYDLNLVCPNCGKQFRNGEIQKYRKHANNACRIAM